MKVVRRSRSLKRQILSRTLVVGLVPLLIVTSVALAALWQLSSAADQRLDDTRNDVTEQAVTDRLEAEAVATGRRVALATTDLATVVSRWAADPGRAALIGEAGVTTTSAVTDPTLARLVDEQADVVSVRLTNRSGMVVAVSADDLDDGDLSQDDVWRRGWIDGQAIGPLRYDGPALDHRLPVAMRITDDQGLPTGVLIAELDLGYVRQIADLDASLGLTATIATVEGAVLADTASDHDVAVVGVPTAGPDQRPPGLDLVDLDAGSATTDAALYGFAAIALGDPTAQADTEADIEGETGQSAGEVTGPDGGDVADTAPAAMSTWTVVIGQSRQDAFGSLAGLEEVNNEIGNVRRELTVLMLVVLAFATFVAIAMAAMLTRQVLSPVRQLTEQAKEAAETGLPDAVERVLAAKKGTTATSADTSLAVDRDDELGDLARSFNSVQESALDLAVDQAAQRRNALAMVANLGRRNQSLVNRQLRFIEELERSEDDPDRLASLFGLDHLATRMRRGAQSFLVLAGHGGASTKLGPVRAEMVVQGALGEVEYYERVIVDQVDPVAIAGHLATDVAHLLAELVENALSCSPPHSRVQVTGQLTADGYRMAVIDQGIGMTDDELAEANALLASDIDLYRRSSPQLGHVVASKLAARHGLSVRLEANASPDEPSAAGIRAILDLPTFVISPASSAPVLAGGATVDAEPPGKPPAPRHRDADRGAPTATTASPTPLLPPQAEPAASVGIFDEVTGEHPVVQIERTPDATPKSTPAPVVRLDSMPPASPHHWPETSRAEEAARASELPEPVSRTTAVFEAQEPTPAAESTAEPATEPAAGEDTLRLSAKATPAEPRPTPTPEPTPDWASDQELKPDPATEPEPTWTAVVDAEPEPASMSPSSVPTAAPEAASIPSTASAPRTAVAPGPNDAPTSPSAPRVGAAPATTRPAAAERVTSPAVASVVAPVATPSLRPGLEPVPTASETAQAASGRYRGEISHQSAAQLTPVTRRRSRRNDVPAAPVGRHPGARRPVVTTASDDEVRAEAERIRNRWRSFQQGRRTAQSTDPTRRPPAPEGDLR